MTVRIGAKVPNSGDLPTRLGIGAMARRLEDAGFDSLWCSDHIVMPDRIESVYPFSDDGRATWDPATPWFDAVVAMALMGAATERAEIGVAVLVLPLRRPVEFAKQIATIDALSGGRVALGVGAGWLAEEFEALEVPFATRGSRLEEWIELLADCWTGTPRGRAGRHYTLPEGVLCEPARPDPPPVLVGGTSQVAIRRAATLGDGWVGLQRAPRLDPGAIAADVAALRDHAERAGRDPDALRVVLRIIESVGRSDVVAAALADRARAGETAVIVDTSWDGSGDAGHVHDRLRAAVG